MFAPIRPTPTKPILEDFIRTKLSYSAKKGETASIQAEKMDGAACSQAYPPGVAAAEDAGVVASAGPGLGLGPMGLIWTPTP